MKQLISILSLTTLFAPQRASAHSGHETDGVVLQLFHIEHILLYGVPTLLLVALAYVFRKEITAFITSRIHNK